MQLSIPYRQHAHKPYWGPTNSNFKSVSLSCVDGDTLLTRSSFCEEDFIITQYVAEVINTLSSFIFCLYAIYGVNSNKNKRDAFLRYLPYFGMATVGIGSAIFHATNQNWAQWCDDLSMLLASSTVLHRDFTYNRSLRFTLILGFLMTVFMTAFIAWHCITDETHMHSLLFGVMVIVLGRKTRWIIEERIKDQRVRDQVGSLATWASVFFIVGFALWNVDNQFCSTLTEWKRAIGMPWSFILELHGWWHFFTCIGGYMFIALAEYLTSEEAGKPIGKNFAWPVGRFLDIPVPEQVKKAI